MIKKILCTGSPLDTLVLAIKSGDYSVDTISEDQAEAFTPTKKALDRFAETAYEYDLLIISNNNGAGYAFAKIVPPELKEKTLVVSSAKLSRHLHGRYEKEGITSFCMRESILFSLEKKLSMLNSYGPADVSQ